MIKERFIGAGEHMPLVPGLLQVVAMIDRNAVKPRPPGGFTPELIHFSEGFEEHVVGCILRFLRIAQVAEREIKNGAAMLFVQSGKFRRRQPRWWRVGALWGRVMNGIGAGWGRPVP